MKLTVDRRIFIAVTLAFLLPLCTQAAVSLSLTDNDSTPNSTTVAPGATFPISAKLTETLTTEQISGVDYQIQASTNGYFKFLSRNSQVSGSLFTSANGFSDAQLTPVVLSPNNGTDLGTSTASGNGAAGPNTYELADFSFQVLPTTPTGVYTLSFIDTSYSGPPPSYTSNVYGSFTTLGTFTVTVAVPEPASTSLLALATARLALRRRTR